MKNNVYFNSSFMDDVGFTTIKELLSASCKFEENKNNFLNLSPSCDKSSIERGLTYTEELFYLLVWYKGINLKRDRLRKVFQNFTKIHKMKSVAVGAGKIYSYSMKDLYTATIQLFKKDIYTWLEEPPKSRPYRKCYHE